MKKPKQKDWFIVDENNNIYAGPITGYQNAAAVADGIIGMLEKQPENMYLSIIEESWLQKKRKQFLQKITSQHNTFHNSRSKK